LIKASKSVQERSKKFLQRHIIEILDECRQKAKFNSERNKNLLNRKLSEKQNQTRK
jgi:hypothetical protein